MSDGEKKALGIMMALVIALLLLIASAAVDSGSSEVTYVPAPVQ